MGNSEDALTRGIHERNGSNTKWKVAGQRDKARLVRRRRAGPDLGVPAIQWRNTRADRPAQLILNWFMCSSD